MALATLSRFSKTERVVAVIAACPSCEGWHLANGYKASLFQVHRPTRDGGLACDGCGRHRPLLVEGEAIPVSVSRWPNLPNGVATVRER